MASKEERKKICILHHGGTIFGEIKSFDDSTWIKVNRCDDRRRTLFKNSKFFDISLPDSYDEFCGYHSECYKNFTAIPLPPENPCQSTSDKVPTLRSAATSELTVSRTGVFEAKCIFCLSVRKKRKGNYEVLGSCMTDQAEKTIKEAADVLNDQHMIVKLAGIDLKSKEVKYHHSCRKEYLNKAEQATSQHEKSERTQMHDKAFSHVKEHVHTKLIETPGAELLQTLHQKYMAILGDSTYEARNLCDKLLKEFNGQIKTCKHANRVIVYNVTLSEDAAIKQTQFEENLKESALHLRSGILKMMHEEPDLPQPITKEAVIAGQGTTPSQLAYFFRLLYTGSSSVSNQERIERQVQSVCDDVIFVTTRGRIKPSKHMSMGLGLKSLTGSKKVVNILNHFGHSVSYHTIEGIETDLATNIIERRCSTPEGIEQFPGLATGIAWDNYDENTETLSGANTLHDTVGICYQNVKHHNDNEDEQAPIPQTVSSTKRISKRSLTLEQRTLEPYHKKPKIRVFQFAVKTIPKPPNFTCVKERDMLWMISLAQGEAPMWAGWNSLITKDPLPDQRIAYMDNLNLPPTRLDVVAETLRISQKVARECDDQYALVHYDLAVAKPAMQIQQQEAPLFDDIFICFGPFHIEQAFFGVLGYFLDGSGGPQLLTETDVLAPGSLNGFLKGKHYNRCKRLHPLLAVAFHILHFRQFLENHDPLSEDLENALHTLNADMSLESLQALEESDQCKGLLNAYSQYTEATIAGDHGSTAKYWMLYIQLVELFQRFNRSCRTNDLDMFMYTLGEMCPVFFFGNRPNYARWMVKYYHNLINMDATHPGLRDVFENGALSIRRSTNSFSRNAVDITLEQTVNADAASRTTGISAFSQSDSARSRWMITRSVRSSIIGHLLELAGLKSYEDVSKSLRPYRQKKDNDNLQSLISAITNTMNPFTLGNDDNLYCLTTGAKVKDEIKDDLLQCQQKGRQWHKEFVDGCFNDPTRFERPIPRRKVQNFASEALKSKVKVKDLKVVELQGTRDLFGRLLYISTLEKIDLEVVFRYPLTPVPLSLSHLDGSFNKTDKAKLLQKLEKKIDSDIPSNIDVVIVDAMFFLHTLVNPPSTFGKLSEEILRRLCKQANRIDFVCDSYYDPSIKAMERERRGLTESTISITGPDQHRPKDWQQALRSNLFKKALIKFLATDWCKDKHSHQLQNRQVYLAYEDKCNKYTSEDDKTIVEEVECLSCKHEEADTRMVLHLYNIASVGRDHLQIAIRSNDTDVLILLLYHSSYLPCKPSVWLDIGLSSNNSRRYINIIELADQIGKPLTDALPGFHSFTGTDTTAAFMNKGKARPFDLMEKSPSHTSVFSRLGQSVPPPSDIYSGLEQFVCAVYGKPQLKSTDDVRYAYFQQNYAPKSKDEPLERIKGLNPSTMPPCHYALENKILRCNYVAYLWRNAHLKDPTSNNKPEGQGWTLMNNMYQVKWFNCDQVPSSICQVLGMDTSPRYIDTQEDDEQGSTIGEVRCESDESDDEWE